MLKRLDRRITPQPSWRLSVAPMLPLIGYGIFIAESVFARPNATWALLLFLWAMGAAVVAYWLMHEKGLAVLAHIDRYAGVIAFGVIGITATVFLVVSVLQARYFALGAHAEDTAYYSQLLWNTLHGDFLAGNVQQERLYNPPVVNDLALHVSPILLVGFLPIYAIYPNFLTILVIRDIVLAAAAWPLFLLVRERVGGTAGVAAVIFYLANPVVIAQGFEAFYLMQLAPLPFFWALRAFSQKALGPFLCWMGVALSLREDVAIGMAGFGLWALVAGRQARWWAAGLGIPLVWWGITTLAIQPAFGRVGNSAFDVALAGGTQAPLNTYLVFLYDPTWIVAVMREGGMEYLYRLLRSVAFLSMLGVEGLLAAPILAALLFLARVLYIAIDPLSHHAVLPSCALIGSAIVISLKIASKSRFNINAFTIILLLFTPSVPLLDGIKDTIYARLHSYTVWNDVDHLRELVNFIPSDASVAAPNYVLPTLSNRRQLFYLQYLGEPFISTDLLKPQEPTSERKRYFESYPYVQPDYILLDRDLDRIATHPNLRRRYIALLESIAHSLEYETLWHRGDYVLVRRVSVNR
jgi:uncharacterized membrane protein